MKYQRYKFDREENDREYKCKLQGKIYVRGYMKEDGTYVHGYCRERTPKERKKYIQRTREFQEILNSIQDTAGVEVRFRHKSGKKKRKR